jgi:hypothetical protein
MGQSRTKPIPISPDCIATVGITKSTEFDIFFPRLQHQPSQVQNALLLELPYGVYSATHDERDIPDGLTSLMHYAKYHSVILEPLQQLVAQANEKKSQLSAIAYNMNLISHRQRVNFLVKRKMRQVTNFARRQCCHCAPLSFSLSSPICLILAFLWIIGIFVAILLDLLICKYCCHNTQSELDLVAKVIIEHSPLDTKSIDEDIRRGLDQLVAKLQLYYPEYYIFIHTYQRELASNSMFGCCSSTLSPASSSATIQKVHWMICFVDKQSPTAEGAGLMSLSRKLQSPPNNMTPV